MGGPGVLALEPLIHMTVGKSLDLVKSQFAHL